MNTLADTLNPHPEYECMRQNDDDEVSGLQLTDKDYEKIAEKLLTKIIEHTAVTVGRSVLNKFFYAIIAGFLGLLYFLKDKA